MVKNAYQLALEYHYCYNEAVWQEKDYNEEITKERQGKSQILRE